MDNLTKIICTIGPASQNASVLKKMLLAGMDCVRLNFSHGTYRQFSSIIKNIRRLSKKLDRETAIIADLQGPKIRTGEIGQNGISVKKGQKILLSANREKNTIPIQYKALPKDVKRGDVILIDDGLIELKVLGVNKQKTQIFCKAEISGIIKSHKGINVPSAEISANPLTNKDKRDLFFALSQDVDYVALSFVKDAEDISALRKLINNKKSNAKIIAKIERHEAIDNMENIIKTSDAVMVARGDLGVEMPAEYVPLYQKKIIHTSNTYGKPVIVATQMLDSMIENPRPTRAEISDAATAIFDHADAFMLSNETAVGTYPVEATTTLQKVASAVEQDIKKHPHLLRLRRPQDMPLLDATCLNACELANDVNAKFIIAITKTGYTAREIAKYRPFIPVIAMTPDKKIQRQLALVWGITKSFRFAACFRNPLPQIKKLLLAKKLAKKGDEIVICNAGQGKEKVIMTARM